MEEIIQRIWELQLLCINHGVEIEGIEFKSKHGVFMIAAHVETMRPKHETPMAFSHKQLNDVRLFGIHLTSADGRFT